MKWIKASERHADFAMSVNLKIDGMPAFGKFYEGANDEINLGFEASNEFGTLYPNQFENVYWLDESPEPIPQDWKEWIKEQAYQYIVENLPHSGDDNHIEAWNAGATAMLPFLEESEYWKQRCEAAEDVLSFYDGFLMGEEEVISRDKWQTLKSQQP